MGLFSLEKKAGSEGAFESIIGDKAKFKGELFSSGSVSVSGEFEGKLSAGGDLVIAPGSKIKGDVKGGIVLVSGRVDGNITATHSLEITRSGRVHGDLAGGKITIEEGSSYRGKVRVETGGNEESKETAKAEETTIIEVQQDAQASMFQNA